MDANEVKALNAMASDAEAVGYRLTSRVAETTSIASAGASAAPVQAVPGGVIIRGAIDTPVYVYTTSGILVKSFRLASEEGRLELQNGVYLVKMNGHITKTTIK